MHSLHLPGKVFHDLFERHCYWVSAKAIAVTPTAKGWVQ